MNTVKDQANELSRGCATVDEFDRAFAVLHTLTVAALEYHPGWKFDELKRLWKVQDEMARIRMARGCYAGHKHKNPYIPSTIDSDDYIEVDDGDAIGRMMGANV